MLYGFESCNFFTIGAGELFAGSLAICWFIAPERWWQKTFTLMAAGFFFGAKLSSMTDEVIYHEIIRDSLGLFGLELAYFGVGSLLFAHRANLYIFVSLVSFSNIISQWIFFPGIPERGCIITRIFVRVCSGSICAILTFYVGIYTQFLVARGASVLYFVQDALTFFVDSPAILGNCFYVLLSRLVPIRADRMPPQLELV